MTVDYYNGDGTVFIPGQVYKFKPVMYTGGSFDVPHLGHYNFLKTCHNLFPNHYFILALNTDEFIQEFKGKPSLFNYKEREKLLMNIEFVNEVVPNIGGKDSTITILKYQPDIIIIGNDWLEKDYCKQMGFSAEWLRKHGITLVYVPYTDGISTTELKERIRNA